MLAFPAQLVCLVAQRGHGNKRRTQHRQASGLKQALVGTGTEVQADVMGNLCRCRKASQPLRCHMLQGHGGRHAQANADGARRPALRRALRGRCQCVLQGLNQRRHADVVPGQRLCCHAAKLHAAKSMAEQLCGAPPILVDTAGKTGTLEPGGGTGCQRYSCIHP